jgi:transcriptional regulator with XRE-family HTH domain
VNLARVVAVEFERRRVVNPRYSLRALARRLGISHSALSRLCRGRAHPGPKTVLAVARWLNLQEADVAAAHRESAGDRLCALVRRPGFTTNVRWIATRLGLSIDEVQVALHDALRRRHLRLTAPDTWTAQEDRWETP